MGQQASTAHRKTAKLVTIEENTMTQNAPRQATSRKPSLPRAQIQLPPLSSDDALTLVDILEMIIAAIWRAHGDDMADLQALRGVETPKPWDAEWECPNPDASDDDDF